MKHWATIYKEVEFDAGHRVPSHNGQCRNLHGHRYRVRAYCRGPIIDSPGNPEDGMLVDFGNLKQLLTEVVHDPLDHGFIVHKNDFTVIDMFEGTDFKLFYFPYIPTAENIARWSFEQLEPRIKEFFNDKLTLDRIECWETPTSCAIYPERMH